MQEWSDIQGSDQYNAMAPADRESLRQHYFNDFVAPHFQDNLENARSTFFNGTSDYQNIPDNQKAVTAVSDTLGKVGLDPGPKTAQAMAGLQEGGSLGFSKPDYVGAPAPWSSPGGIGQHLSRIGGNLAAIIAPGALAERGAAAGLGVAGDVASTVAPEAVNVLKAAGSKAVASLPEAAQSVLARITPGAAARGVGWGGLGAVQAEGATNGQASAQQLLQSSLGAAATGVLVPPAIGAIGEATGAASSRLSQAIKGRFPGIFTAADQVKTGLPEPQVPETPAANTPSFQKPEFQNGVLMSEARLGGARQAAVASPSDSPQLTASSEAPVDPERIVAAMQNARDVNADPMAGLTAKEQALARTAGQRMMLAKQLTGRASEGLTPDERDFLQPSTPTQGEPPMIPAQHLQDVAMAEQNLNQAQKALYDRIRGGGQASPPSPVPLPAGAVPSSPPNAQPGPLSSRATQGPEAGAPQAPGQYPQQPVATPGAPVAAPAGGPQAANVKLDQFNVSPAVKSTMQTLALNSPEDYELAGRGVQSWQDTLNKAGQLKTTAEQFLNMKAGAALNAEQSTLLKQMVAAQGQKVLAAATPDALTDPAAQATLASETAKLNELQARYSGDNAEAGRALQVRKLLVSALDSGDQRLIGKAMDVTGNNLTPEQIISLNNARLSGDPKQIYQAISDLNPPDWADKLHAYDRNNLLSSPASMQTVGSSSITQNLLRLANIPVRATLDKAMSAMTGAERTTFMGQFIPAAKAAWEAIPDAASNAYTKLTTGVSPSDLSALEMGRRPVLPGILDAPERAIGALHQFAYTVAHNSELASQAAKQAIKDGATDVEAGMQKYLKAPTPEMLASAQKAGQSATFTSELGPWGKGISGVINTSLKDANPNLPNLRPLKFIVPFMNVGTNILKEAYKYAGGGVISGLASGGEAGMADLAKAAMGVPIAAFFASKLSSGDAWGSGPPTTNQAERDRFLREHDGITNGMRLFGKTVSFDRFGEPINVMLKTMANLHDAYVYNDQHPSDNNAARLVFSFGKSIVDNSYTANVASALNAMQDAKKFQSLAQQEGQQFLPMSAASRYITQNVDPVVRDTRGATLGQALTNTVRSITPGLSQDLPPRRDELGNEIARKEPYTPFKIIDSANDPDTQFLKDVNVTPPNVPSRLGNRPLSPSLQSQLLDERGQAFKQIIAQYRGQESSPNTAIMVKELFKSAAQQVDQKYKGAAELEAHGLPATPENGQRVQFAVGMPWFKNMSETDKANYLKTLIPQETSQ